LFATGPAVRSARVNLFIVNETESNCQHLKVLDALILKERELREAFEQRMDERDKRYEDRFTASDKAVTAALSATEKSTSTAFNSSEKAITKSETSQTVYNANHNDLSRKMEAQYKEMLPRTEAESKFRSLEEKIADLRESRSVGQGGRGVSAIWWAIGASILTAVVIGLILKSIK